MNRRDLIRNVVVTVAGVAVVPSAVQWQDDAEARWDAFLHRLRDRIREIAEGGHEVEGCCISPDYGDGQPRLVVVWLADEEPMDFYL